MTSRATPQAVRAPAGRRVSRPHDADEREAVRAADVVARGGSVAGWSFSNVAASASPVHRQEAAPKSDEEKKKEAVTKAGEAALETPQGKALKEKVLADPVVKTVKDAVTSAPGLIATGAAAVGGVGALAATGKALPFQPPAIPLDRITPGLSAKVTYEGPVNSPTFVGLSITYKEQGPKGGKKAAERNQIAADIARLRAEREMFKTEDQKRQEAELVQSWVTSQAGRLPSFTIPLKGEAKPEEKKEEQEAAPVQPAPASASASASVETPARAHVDGALATPGRPLEAPARRAMEARFGYDFSGVRVHDDARAAETAESIHAAAFTVGQDVVFAGGRYDPSSADGRRLLAHELAHVVQQTGGERRGADAQPLPASTRRDLERRFRAPLGDVRIHAGEEGRRVAATHSAVAVARDSELFFAAGAWAPGTDVGDRILRHEVAHLLQARMTGIAPWSDVALEAEAELHAAVRGPLPVRGRASGGRPQLMKTFVSTVGGSAYLDVAVKFYKLWEGETATRIAAYQDVVDNLATDTSPLKEFRIVAHGNAYNLFLPLLAKAKEYAERPALGLQTQEALAVELGKRAHPTGDDTARVYGWLSNDKAAQPLLARLGLTAAPTGMLQEFLWWVIDEHYAANATESAGGKQSTSADRTSLQGKVAEAQAAAKSLAAARLPAKATATDLDELRTRALAAFEKAGWKWSAGSGELKDKLKLFETPEAAALLREVKAGTFESRLKAVKGRVGDKTHLEIRGCNIGQNDDYLNGIREFFGRKPDKLPSISAPKLYQFFGTPGVQVLPEGKRAPAVADSLKFFFEEVFDDTTTAKKVQTAVQKAGLASVGDIVEVLRHADVKAEFEKWWQMKQAKAGAKQPVAAATLKDFQDFLTASPRTFPINAPGKGPTSLFFLILIPSTAIPALLAWVKDQGYTLPGGADLTKHFTGGTTKWSAATFSGALDKLFVDWLGDKFPVPEKIYFPEDPEYKANIRRLP